ncbi:glycosyl transferase, family 39 [Pedosphaera parvula Ellin514]|uniref:Glycosyl transferase, family 39 n=1 Tax=Pedosphaera parvula (strain Ellin514) TaxID=320771 RepID=B9XPL0_PEDPL|nr:glycosyl transferase, family 39 [Pedosphaera parvula Ellin514]
MKVPASRSLSPLWIYGLLILILLVTAAIRFRLRELPLERDEGEYAYAGQLMLQGIPPYQLAYNMKFPGTYAAYALLMALFGQTPTGIHLGLLIVNAGAILLVYFLTARLSDKRAGLIAAALYAYLSLSAEVLGPVAHATHFVILPALGGLLLLLHGINRRSSLSLFASGVLLGFSVLMKQHGAFFILFAGSYLIYRNARPLKLRQLGVQATMLALGIATPLALTVLLLWKAGVLDKFWFWTIKYAREYATEYPGNLEVFKNLAGSTPHVLYPLAWAAVLGLVILWRKADRTVAIFSTGFFVCSVLTIFPNFNFRPHYYVLLLPAVAMLTGVLVISAREYLLRAQSRIPAALPVALLLIFLAGRLFHERALFFQSSPAQACRLLYPRSAFPESVQIAQYLKAHSPDNARIAVLGSEPQIYFYSQRHSATGYIYTYALMELQPYALQMQRELISEIETTQPDYIVSVEDGDSWIVRQTSEPLIFNWSAKYLQTHYNKVGLLEILPDGQSSLRWGDDIKTSRKVMDVYLNIFKRKDSN